MVELLISRRALIYNNIDNFASCCRLYKYLNFR